MKRFRFGYIKCTRATTRKSTMHIFCHGQDGNYIVAVDNLEQACQVAKQWAEEDKVDLIELCGAFWGSRGRKGKPSLPR